jgi:hypothetical protein
MIQAMGTNRHTFCERTPLGLAIGLVVACAANLALLCVFL